MKMDSRARKHFLMMKAMERDRQHKVEDRIDNELDRQKDSELVRHIAMNSGYTSQSW